ncbi:MAG: hypothetical protein J0M24_10720 [Verrucomicrobia bacterium]|nr:hypothetical protein [Verrucomicrobiota bacterium]
MPDDFDVPTSTPEAKPPPGEPDTNPRRKPATTPASSKEIAQAAEKRRESYAKEPAPVAPADAATPVPEAPDSLPADMQKAVLRACRAEAQALLKAYAIFVDHDAKMYGIVDAESARKRRDALTENITLENFQAVLTEWTFLSVVASKPDGYGMLLRAVELWRMRQFEPTTEAARVFYRRIGEEVEKLKTQAAEAERGFFSRLFGGKQTGKSAAAALVAQQCEHLAHVGPHWDNSLTEAVRNIGFCAAVHVPGTLLELAQQAVDLPE